jgi:yecA family protein
MKKTSPGATPLTDEEFARLAAFPGSIKNGKALTLEGVDGLLRALIAGYDLVMPSEYLPVVWGGELPDENAFESEEAAQTLIGLILRHWNAIAAEYGAEDVYVPLLDDADERGVRGRRWAQGVMRGVKPRQRSWTTLFTDENEGQLATIAIVVVAPDRPKAVRYLSFATVAFVTASSSARCAPGFPPGRTSRDTTSIRLPTRVQTPTMSPPCT